MNEITEYIKGRWKLGALSLNRADMEKIAALESEHDKRVAERCIALIPCGNDSDIKAIQDIRGEFGLEEKGSE